MKTAIVLLYGQYTPDRTDYAHYLDEVADDILTVNVDRVILCGGYTNPAEPSISEAATAKEYLADKLQGREVTLEDRSITTNQNLEFAATKITTADKLIVYCDTARKAKVIWLALHFLLHADPRQIYRAMLEFSHQRKPAADFVYENLTVKGRGYSKTETEILGQTYAGILDVMALSDPAMNTMDLDQRKQDFGLKS